MTGTTETPESDPEIREEYDEYEVGDSRIGIITDPQNEYAWIWSDQVQAASP